jgi:hypothetical protein
MDRSERAAAKDSLSQNLFSVGEDTKRAPTCRCQGSKQRNLIFWKPVNYLNQATPWSRGLPEKLTGPQLLKKFPKFNVTQRFITAFTRARHLFLSKTRSIYSVSSTPLL